MLFSFVAGLRVVVLLLRSCCRYTARFLCRQTLEVLIPDDGFAVVGRGFAQTYRSFYLQRETDIFALNVSLCVLVHALLRIVSTQTLMRLLFLLLQNV